MALGTEEAPDVLARYLAEARNILEREGWLIEKVTTTRPRKQGGPAAAEGEPRVARQLIAGKGRVALTVVRESQGLPG